MADNEQRNIDKIPRSTCVSELVESDSKDCAQPASSSTEQPVLEKKVGPSPFRRDLDKLLRGEPEAATEEDLPRQKVRPSRFQHGLSLFLTHPVRSDESPYMIAVMNNDMNAIREASTEGLGLEDFKRAFMLLDRFNPDWRTRSAGDLTRAVIRGLENEISRMEAQPSSQSPS